MRQDSDGVGGVEEAVHPRGGGRECCVGATAREVTIDMTAVMRSVCIVERVVETQCGECGECGESGQWMEWTEWVE